MKEIAMTVFLGLALLAAPAVQACDMHKSDTKVMSPEKSAKPAKVAKSSKSTQKTAQKKMSTSKI